MPEPQQRRKAPPTALVPDGYTHLTGGKIAAVVTYLALQTRPERPAAASGSWTLERIGPDVERYLHLYRAVGEPWLWFSRLALARRALQAILGDPEVDAFAVRGGGGADIGLVELDWREPDACELAFLGVVPDAIGTGAGHFALSNAIDRAFARPIARLHVHTCTLDHPRALAFYRRAGFVPYRQAIEVADDPRLLGLLPREAAPQVPLIEGTSPQ